MVAEAREYSDVEGALRTWGRSTLTDLGGRVFFEAANAPFPQIVLKRVAGAHDPLVQFEVFGNHKADAWEAAADLAFALDTMAAVQIDGVLLAGASVEQGPRWLPDPESGRARYIVDATVSSGVVV